MSKYESNRELEKKILDDTRASKEKLEKESRISADLAQVREAIKKHKGGDYVSNYY
jgi:hypothetical protein